MCWQGVSVIAFRVLGRGERREGNGIDGDAARKFPHSFTTQNLDEKM